MTETKPEIKLYNTRTRSKEVFAPIDPDNVRMYVCGPTVYDRAHIGNARPVVVFDVLYRLLRHVFGEDAVTYVRNFTDVDDRIIEKAVATKGADETLEAATRRITDETISWYHEDMDALGALRPDHEPRCTDPRMMTAMVAMSQELIDKGYAYAAEGHVLFSVEAYEKYGSLSGRSVDDMIAGARVEVAPYKKNPMDFVIWKPSTDEQPGWDSPWGRGRPGWHIECSAMAKELLGEVFDIHAGGIDLAFPHHENELAQSCCAHGTERMANWWMHNEMLRVEGEKMSKSLGNFFTVWDVRNGVGTPDRNLYFPAMHGVEIRLNLLVSHYRQPLDWRLSRVNEVRSWLLRWSNLANQRAGAATDAAIRMAGVPSDFLDALCDDLNTPKAISVMHGLFDAAQDATNDGNAALSQLLACCQFLGLDWNLERKFEIMQVVDRALSETKINRLIEERNEARKSKDFARADAIRDGFAAAGVIVKDTPDGAVWELSPDFDATKLEALR